MDWDSAVRLMQSGGRVRLPTMLPTVRVGFYGSKPTFEVLNQTAHDDLMKLRKDRKKPKHKEPPPKPKHPRADIHSRVDPDYEGRETWVWDRELPEGFGGQRDDWEIAGP